MCKLNFKRLLASFFALLLCLSPVVVQADEAGYTIQDYAVQATYHSNNTISVNETIAVNFTESRHGIYRNIPLNMYVGFTDEEKAELQEVVQFLKAPEKFNSLGARIPHGVLLVGPPGTGKTSVALRAMVEEFLLEKENTENNFGLMLMAYTNRAVDEICTMLDGIKASYVRIGGEQTCAEAHRDHLLTRLFADRPRRRDVVRKLQTIPIVVGTVSTLSNHLELFRLRPYHAIIDEADRKSVV